jgi:hypothetical protein
MFTNPIRRIYGGREGAIVPMTVAELGNENLLAVVLRYSAGSCESLVVPIGVLLRHTVFRIWCDDICWCPTVVERLRGTLRCPVRFILHDTLV